MTDKDKQDKIEALQLFESCEINDFTVTRVPEGLVYRIGSGTAFVKRNDSELEELAKSFIPKLMEYINSTITELQRRVDEKKRYDEEFEKIVSSDMGKPYNTGEKLFHAVAPDFKEKAAPKKAAPKKAAPKKAATKKASTKNKS